MALNSILSNGCIISGGSVRRSILSPQVRVNSYAEVENSILLDGVDVGRNAKIRRAIIDKEVQIPAGTEIGYRLEEDAKRFTVTGSGIVVVPKWIKL
jgi:glucose-1-phosphate adenylyltransferase